MAEAVIPCHTVEAWTQQLEQAKDSKKLIDEIYRILQDCQDCDVIIIVKPGQLVVVDFTASWCGPCRMMAPLFAELAKKFTDVVFLKVDVDELKTVAQDWAIEAMPTFIFMKEGTIVDKIVGARKDDLPKKIEQHK